MCDFTVVPVNCWLICVAACLLQCRPASPVQGVYGMGLLCRLLTMSFGLVHFAVGHSAQHSAVQMQSTEGFLLLIYISCPAPCTLRERATQQCRCILYRIDRLVRDCRQCADRLVRDWRLCCGTSILSNDRNGPWLTLSCWQAWQSTMEQCDCRAQHWDGASSADWAGCRPGPLTKGLCNSTATSRTSRNQ